MDRAMKKNLFTMTLAAGAVLLLSFMTLHAQDRIGEDRLQQLKERAGSGDASANYELALRSKSGALPSGTSNLSDYSTYLAEAARLKHRAAMLQAAIHMIDGDYLAKNPTTAFAFLEELVKQTPSQARDSQASGLAYEDRPLDLFSFARACYHYGRCLDNGFGVRPDRTRAQKYFALASPFIPEARQMLSRGFLRGSGTEKNSDLGLLLLYLLQTDGKGKDVLSFYRQNAPQGEKSYIPFLEKQMKNGDSTAAYLLGKAYLYGEGTTIDRTKAFQYFESAAAMGNRTARRELAGHYTTGDYVARDLEKALTLLQSLLSENPSDIRANAETAAILLQTKRNKEALPFLISAGKLPEARKIIDSDPAMRLGAEDIYLRAKEFAAQQRSSRKTPGEFPESQYTDLLRMAANAGSLPAAVEYAQRAGNQEMLLESLEKEAAGGSMTALFKAAEMYRLGRGTKGGARNYAKAFSYYGKAAEKGSLPALRMLSRLYESGAPGVPRDPVKAQELSKKLAEQSIFVFRGGKYAPFYRNYFETVLQSGKEHSGGNGALVRLLNGAARNPDAAYYLAEIYRRGMYGVKKDPVAAAALYNQAAAPGGSYRRQAWKRLETLYREGEENLKRDTETADRYQQLLAG